MSFHHPTNTTNKRNDKKRVEFSSPLKMESPPSPSGPAAASSATLNHHTWDSETDHMLSYFLGGGGGGMGETLTMPADFTSTHPHSHDDGDNHHHHGGIEIIMEEKEGEHKKAEHLKIGDNDDDDSFVPPPTPLAPQFYTKKSTINRSSDNASKSSASDASVTAMAHTLITGGPVLQNLAEAPSSMSLTSLSSSGQHQSPLSPALMLSNHTQSPENLLFPPESVYNPAQHRAWLQELNARAMAARQASTTQPHASTQHPSMPPPNQQSTAQMQQHHAQQQALGHPPPYPMAPSGSAYLSTGGTAAHHLWMAQHQHHTQNAAAAAHLPMSAAAAAAAMTPAESEEKRAKRLERNRESARKSRRKKKERLESLEAAVQLMQSKIAAERLVQMAGMVAGLQAKRRQVREHFDTVEAPRIAMRESGPRSSIFQSVVDFSYTALKLDLLPPYQKFWLWLTRQPESFFLSGKLTYVQARENVSMGRISSKQVGEEWSKESGPPLRRTVDEDGNSVVPKNTSYADDAVRYWPLVCYEHQFSVDQEERFLALHKRIASSEDTSWTQAVESIQAVSSLSQAMTSVCGMASQREERTWVGILSGEQASKFQKWLTPERLEALRPPPAQVVEDASLSDICRRLKQVAISKATDK